MTLIFKKEQNPLIDQPCLIYQCIQIPLTRVGLLRFTAELPNAVAIAKALIHDAMYGLIPRFPDLIEGPRLRLLALICTTKVSRVP